jgi:hypothetical protein
MFQNPTLGVDIVALDLVGRGRRAPQEILREDEIFHSLFSLTAPPWVR